MRSCSGPGIGCSSLRWWIFRIAISGVRGTCWWPGTTGKEPLLSLLSWGSFYSRSPIRFLMTVWPASDSSIRVFLRGCPDFFESRHRIRWEALSIERGARVIHLLFDPRMRQLGGNREGFPVEQTGSIVTALNQGSLLRGLGFPLLILLMSSCASFRAAPAHPDLVWPLPPEPPRIRYAQIIREAKDIGFNPNFFRRVIDFLFGEPLTPQVIRPIGVATDSEGRLYVADNGLQVIHIFDLAKKEYRQVFWLSPSGPARLKNPVGVAVDRENHLYVSDADLNRIFVFDRKGTLRSTIGSDEDLMRVSSIAVDPKREILYAVDTPG